MSYKYNQSLFRSLGFNINDIVNSAEAKEKVRIDWKYLQQYKRFEKEIQDKQYAKDLAWWEYYCLSTVRYYNKVGDMFRLVRVFINKFSLLLLVTAAIFYLVFYLLSLL